MSPKSLKFLFIWLNRVTKVKGSLYYMKNCVDRERLREVCVVLSIVQEPNSVIILL